MTLKRYVLLNIAIAGLSGVFIGPALVVRDALKRARRFLKEVNHVSAGE